MEQLKKWLKVDCSVLRQKSRVQRLKEGAHISKLFHSMVKTRNLNNRIVKLTNDAGVVLEDKDNIKSEVLSFYVNFLGTSKAKLLGVDTTVLKTGPMLHQHHRRGLIKDVL